MGRTPKSWPSFSLALTCYSDSRARNVSPKRMSSDQFRPLQTGSMDVSGEQEHDRTHLRDLLTCSARSAVSPVRGSESGGVFRPRKYQKEGLGTSFHCNSETRHSKRLRKPASSIPKHTQTLRPGSARAWRNAGASPKFRAATAILTAFDFEKVRPSLKMVLDCFKVLSSNSVAPTAGFLSLLLLYHLLNSLLKTRLGRLSG
jgi:hypothetical protein